MTETHKSKNGRFNRHLIKISVIAIIYSVVACIYFSPQWLNFAEYFLPPHCESILFDEVITNPSTKMKLIQDIFWRTQVIAVDEAGQDICFFKLSSSWSLFSPDRNYLAFAEAQFITDREYIWHFLIVNVNEESYARFTVENPQEFLGFGSVEWSWSPDSTKLAFISFSDVMCCVPPPDVYLTVISLEADLLWRVTLGKDSRYDSGNLFWTDDGNAIRYGRNKTETISHAMGQAFWCSVNQDGSNLLCEDVAIED